MARGSRVSAQRDALGQNVCDAEGQVVGRIEDLILTRKIGCLSDRQPFSFWLA
jgi:sporulation protein YlmC with PRC-barrel domain